LRVEHTKDIKSVFVVIADAGRDRRGALGGAAFVGGAVIGRDFGALEILARDEVDHAADRVGAVDRRRAVEQDFDTLNGCRRNVVEVDTAVVARRGEVGHAPPIEQHQRRRGAQAAQVGRVEAHLVAESTGADAHAVGQIVRRGRDLRHQLGRGRHARLVDRLAGDDLHRQRGFRVDAFDRRTRHFHALQLLLRRGFVRGGLGNGGRGKGDQQGMHAGLDGKLGQALSTQRAGALGHDGVLRGKRFRAAQAFVAIR
jgi:hypothetical protein